MSGSKVVAGTFAPTSKSLTHNLPSYPSSNIRYIPASPAGGTRPDVAQPSPSLPVVPDVALVAATSAPAVADGGRAVGTLAIVQAPPGHPWHPRPLVLIGRKECAWVDDEEDAEACVEFYLTHPKLAAAIAEAADDFVDDPTRDWSLR